MLDIYHEANSQETYSEEYSDSTMPQNPPGGPWEDCRPDPARIIEDMPVWVQICSLDGTIQRVNEAAVRISGYERREMEGQTWPYPWFARSEANQGYSRGWGTDSWPYRELERSGCIPEFEVVYTTPREDTRVLGVTLTLARDQQGRPQHVLLVAWDHTQRQAREVELARAQKIQAVNQLASGIAHDINNNLAVILGYSEYLLGTAEAFSDQVRQALSAIHDQSLDCANTVRRIQLFSRTVHKSQLAEFSVNAAVQDVINAAQEKWREQPREEGREILLEADLVDLEPVLAFEDGFKEALAAVLGNAVDALPQGGVVSIKTTGREGGGVVVQVRDNGMGIPPLQLSRAFDAFYTTKGPASSGLGLTIAYSLITQQGGQISVDSREGKGTAVTITLPPCANAAGRPGNRLPAAAQRGLSVLLVEDEPQVAGVYRTFLETFGHRVVACFSGTEALEAFRSRDFDLALVDLGMPGMDGWEVSRQMLQQRPDLPIIVATGWNVCVADGQEQGVPVRAVLKKPFGMYDLDRAVQEALG